MNAIDRIKEKTQHDYRSFEVDEWADETGPFKIFFSAFTLADIKKIRAKAKSDEQEALAYTVIQKALNEEGKPLFTVEDKRYLMTQVDSDILVSIVTRLNTRMDSEELEKN